MSDENKNAEVVQELENEAMNQLETLKEDNNKENEEVIKDAKEKIKAIFEDLQEWIKENTEPEKVKEGLNKAKDETVKVLKATKEKALEISNSEQFKNTVSAGKDFLIGAGVLIGDGIKAGADALMKNDNIKNFVNTADEKLDVLRESEGLKNAVDSAEQITQKVGDAVFSGIRKFLDKKDRTTSDSGIQEDGE